MSYRQRLIDFKINTYLEKFGAVAIEGIKYCGKTTSCEHFANTKIYFQDPSETETLKNIVEENPLLFFNGSYPILFDEWTEYPVLEASVKYKINQLHQKGCFLLTSSIQSESLKTIENKATRFRQIKMRPLSLFESKYTETKISLTKLFYGGIGKFCRCNLTLNDYIEIICRGGWPASRDLEIDQALEATNQYVTKLSELPVSLERTVPHQATIYARLLSSIARNILTQTPFSKIKNEVITESIQLTERSVYNYYERLANYFIVDDIPAWNPPLRTKSRPILSPKHNFIDPSIAVGALGLNPELLMNDLKYYQSLFKSLVIRDLRTLIDDLKGGVYYYGDNNGLDIDVIIQLRNGRWGAVQIVVGSNQIEQASRELDLFINKLDFTKIKQPAFLIIITGAEYSYPRKDGKTVVPFGLLEP